MPDYNGFIVIGLPADGQVETRRVDGGPIVVTDVVAAFGVGLIERAIVQRFIDAAGV